MGLDFTPREGYGFFVSPVPAPSPEPQASTGSFTPGPWYAGRAQLSFYVEDGEIVRAHVPIRSEQYEDEARANAHLIAAAPDLYGALAQIERDLEYIAHLAAKRDAGHSVEHYLRLHIRAALRKARGES